MKRRGFFRQTLVETALDHPVMVSTIKNNHRDYETLVFPVIYGVILKPGIELARTSDNRPRRARRTHRLICQYFNRFNRSYEFNQREE